MRIRPTHVLMQSTKRNFSVAEQATALDKIRFVFRHYNIGFDDPSRATYSALPGKKACPPLLIQTDQGEFVLKSIAFDEESAQFVVSTVLRLEDERLPAIKLIRRNDGGRGYYFQLGDRYYILYKFVPGLIRDPLLADSRHIERAGEMLARVHIALKEFSPAGKKTELPVIAITETKNDFAGLGQTIVAMQKRRAFSLSRSNNLFLGNPPFFIDQFEILSKNLPAATYNGLPHSVIYGDFNFTNLVFSEEGEIIGFFDAESMRIQPRIEDFKNPITSVGPNKGRIFKRPLYEAFLRGYQRIQGLDEEEINKLPEIIRGTFLWSLADLFLMRKREIDRNEQTNKMAQDMIREFREFAEQF